MRARRRPACALGALLTTSALLAGAAPAGAALLPPSLTADTAFAPPAGIARFDFRPGNSAPDVPTGIAVSGERTYTVGESASPTQNPDRGKDVAIIARRADGSLDPGFDGDGKLSIAVAPGNGLDTATAVAVLADGRIRIAGYTDVDPGTAASAVNLDAMLIGLLPDGSPDTSFGQDADANGTRDGVQVFAAVAAPTSNNEQLTGLAVDPDSGRIAVAGPRSDGGQDDIFVSLREADGSPVTGFGTLGVRVIDRDGAQRDEAPTAVQFRPGGGVMALVDADTNASAAPDGDIAVLRAFTPDGRDDGSFGTQGELVLTPGSPDTVPSALLVHNGRYYVTGKTRPAPGTDFDAFLARLDADGSGVVSRRFDMRGQVVPGGESPQSEGLALAVVPGVPTSLVVVGSVRYAFAGDTREDWGAAAFNGFEGDLGAAGFGDLVLDTPNRVNRLTGVAAAGEGIAMVAGPLDAEPRPDGSVVQDTSFGNARFLIDREKRCNLSVKITAPLELVLRGLAPSTVGLEVQHVGTRPCAGVVDVPAPFAATGGSISTGLLTPGDVVRYPSVGVTYVGARPIRQSQLQVSVTPVGDTDSDAADNLASKLAAFAYCDVGLLRLDEAAQLPNEGSRNIEVRIRNSGTLTCPRAGLKLSGAARLVQPFAPFTLVAGSSATDKLPVAAPKGAVIGRDVRFDFLASSSGEDLNPADNRVGVTARVVAVGDTRIRAAGPRTLSGTATNGRGGRSKTSTTLSRVEISVESLKGKQCRHLRSVAGRLATTQGRRSAGCRSPIWLRATGTRRWSVKLKGRLPAGRYRLRSRAVTRNGFPEATFGTKDRNSRIFRVR
jgi:uncharacterized delta-60 repeat protein